MITASFRQTDSQTQSEIYILKKESDLFLVIKKVILDSLLCDKPIFQANTIVVHSTLIGHLIHLSLCQKILNLLWSQFSFLNNYYCIMSTI